MGTNAQLYGTMLTMLVLTEETVPAGSWFCKDCDHSLVSGIYQMTTFLNVVEITYGML